MYPLPILNFIRAGIWIAIELSDENVIVFVLEESVVQWSVVGKREGLFDFALKTHLFK